MNRRSRDRAFSSCPGQEQLDVHGGAGIREAVQYRFRDVAPDFSRDSIAGRPGKTWTTRTRIDEDPLPVSVTSTPSGTDAEALELMTDRLGEGRILAGLVPSRMGISGPVDAARRSRTQMSRPSDWAALTGRPDSDREAPCRTFFQGWFSMRNWMIRSRFAIEPVLAGLAFDGRRDEAPKGRPARTSAPDLSGRHVDASDRREEDPEGIQDGFLRPRRGRALEDARSGSARPGRPAPRPSGCRAGS